MKNLKMQEDFMNLYVRSLGIFVALVSLFFLFQTQVLSAQESTAPRSTATTAMAAEPQAAGQMVSSSSQVIPALPVPRLIKFSGVAKDASGQPRSGVVGIMFSIYASQEGGTALWMETQNMELDAHGHYAVLLGTSQSAGVPLDLFATGEPRWLGAKVELPGEVEQPRVLLVSVPYALKAVDADTLGGKPASAFMAAPTFSASGSSGAAVANSAAAQSGAAPALAGTGSKNYVPLWLSSTKLGDSKLYQRTGGDIGIGTTTPAATLDVNGAVNAATSYKLGSNLFAFGSYASANVFLGFAGNTATTGLNNTAIGYQALLSTDGLNNTAIGYQALLSNTNGDGNTAIGQGALLSNTGGAANTAIGQDALQFNTEGDDNTAIGSGALGAMANTGTFNTAIGLYALGSNSSGGFNTAIGAVAGGSVDGSLVVGSFNTAVGEFSGVSTGTLTNTTAVGGFAEVAESNAIVLGSINGVNTASSNVSVGIGTTTPGATLDVRDNGFGGNTISATSAAVNNAVYGNNTSTSGLANGAAFYTASSAGTAVVGVNTGTGGNHYAGYFQGNVLITGNLAKSTGSFQIDHPLDPANKYLYHSFVESPDMMNIYNGVATLDVRGAVWITLPEYFEALNQEFRYQLTSIGRPQPSLYVAREISGNRFRISGGKAGGKVSWQVTGIRHDAYADAHRIQVEVEKPPQEQGHYLHPELFGAPAEQAIGYHAPPVPPEHATQAETARVSPMKAPLASLK